ncbi:iron uptake transporter permease EfeU [Streptomyces sp. NPDC090306]|uniref:iron uptake transporter permease EfeU n=1 Tax=Streptomyces sp. NPDC090306 TaxID=3365961 RepID=UPI00381C124B
MLPTFVIGLREALEAALIVGIIAAFLGRQGRRDLLRWMWAGVGVAVLLCVGVGVALEVLSSNLPQRQQEGLETVIGVLAVGMVTYMVVWMRRHSRDLKGQLEGMAADAIGDGGTGRAMVVMAFLAVVREGFETVVFLLAAFNETANRAAAAGGAVSGIAVALVLGYAIYRGGVRLNLSKFFRVTGLVLVLVAAGLVVNALHTAHEAGWLEVAQARTVDLSWLVKPGSVRSALLTGMLGIQPYPVVAEVVGWLVYLLPVGLYVAWPPKRGLSRRNLARLLGACAAAAAVTAVCLAAVAPAAPASAPLTRADGFSARLTDGNAVLTQLRSPADGSGTAGATTRLALRRGGEERHGGLNAVRWTATRPGEGAKDRPARMTWAQAAALNGGRLPLGVVPASVSTSDTTAVTWTDADLLQVWTDPATGRVVDLRWTETVRATLTGTRVGSVVLDSPAARGTWTMPAPTARAATEAARHDARAARDNSRLTGWAWFCGVGALALLAATCVTALRARRLDRDRPEAPVPAPADARGPLTPGRRV